METRLVRIPAWCMLFVVLLGAPVSDAAQETVSAIAPKHHPWGRFQPGAWKRVRVVTETLDEKGLVVSTSTTDTKTTLMAVGENGVTLEKCVAVELAGKRFVAEPETVKEGFHGEPLNENLKALAPAAAEVTVEGRKVPCHVQQLELDGTAGKTVTRVYYSGTVDPYVLRREATTSDAQSGDVLSQTLAEVTALDMPWKVSAEIKKAALVKTVCRHSRGTITTWAVTASDVPGGVVCNTSKEVDRSGRLIRRSTLELVDYGTECEPARAGLFGRLRRPRTVTP
jgi:hypothetical protein